MHRSALLALLAAGFLVGLPPAGAAAGQLENLLALCSNPDTPAQDALNACRKAAEGGRLDARRRSLAWLNAGIAAYGLGRYDEAVAAQTNAIAADPRLSAAYENRALVNDKLNRLDDALADYAAAISIAPNNPGGYLGRGILMLNRNAADRALPDFNRALELDPKLVTARYNRGLALLQLGDFAAAEADFTNVIGHSPKDAGAYLNRGRARAAQGSGGARNDLDRAIALRPEWAVAWYVRGRYFDAKGDTDAANADFQRAYQLGHADPWLIERMRTMSGQ